jgi:hypothetical protein
MSKDHLATYLNDHAAGAVAAIDMLEHLEANHRDTELARFAADLRKDVEADNQELENLIKTLDISEGKTRKAAAWLAEKFTDLKLRWDDSSDGPLRLLEVFEALGLGISGKRYLWLALDFAKQDTPALNVTDYQRLIARAEEQRNRVERMRLHAAKAALVFND